LFLRPTESLTVFLQQLGRGLRLSEGKDCLTVLDLLEIQDLNMILKVKFSIDRKTTTSVQKKLKMIFHIGVFNSFRENKRNNS
jgi:superfamily II DNA or RNA helicase